VAAANNGAPRSTAAIEHRPAPGDPRGSATIAGGLTRNRSTILLFLLAAVIVLFVIVWTFAYRLGHDRGQQSVLSHTDSPDAAAITGQNATTPTTGLGSSSPLPAPTTPVNRSGLTGEQPATSAAQPSKPAIRPGPMPPIVSADSRQPGNNYLQLVPLTWRDAEPAIRYLQASGIRATSFPADQKVDPARLQPKNLVRIFVDQPYASGTFRGKQAERDQLVADIRRAGKKWQTEHRGASDFSDFFWGLYRGK